MNNQKSIFSKIIDREIDAYIVWEDEEFIAFLDINPISAGHTLLVPKKQVDKFYELDNETYTKLFLHAKSIAQKMEKIMKCQRVGMIIEGFMVPHVHIHLIPLNDNTSLETKRIQIPKEEMLNIALKLKEGLK